jgi:hypothetical protein
MKEQDILQFAGIQCAHAGGTDRSTAVSRAHGREAIRIFRDPGTGNLGRGAPPTGIVAAPLDFRLLQGGSNHAGRE